MVRGLREMATALLLGKSMSSVTKMYTNTENYEGGILANSTVTSKSLATAR